MSFSIQRFTEQGLEQVLLQDNETQTGAVILPKYGGILNGLFVMIDGKKINLIESYPDDVAAGNIAKSFLSSKLSPFVCRMANAQYTLNGKLFEIENKFVDGNAIHGLLYDKAFTIVSEFSDDEKASVTLKYNYKKDDKGYPFSYRCEVTYTLLPSDLLKIETVITNLDDETIPLSDGWHPYFSLGGKINDWQLYFNADAMVEFNDKLIPTGQLVEYDSFNEEKPIGETFLDNCFLLKQDETIPCCTLYNPENKTGISFYPDSSYPYLQIYTPPHRKSIAIENLSSVPDAFNNKMGLILLEPRRTKTFTVYYKIERE